MDSLVHPMSFYYMNLETIGKFKNELFFSNLKKCTNPAYEFLLHKCRNKNEKIIIIF